MPPSFPYKMGIQVEDISGEVSEEQQGTSSIIRVYINKTHQSQPILAATVNMPSIEVI